MKIVKCVYLAIYVNFVPKIYMNEWLVSHSLLKHCQKEDKSDFARFLPKKKKNTCLYSTYFKCTVQFVRLSVLLIYFFKFSIYIHFLYLNFYI